MLCFTYSDPRCSYCLVIKSRPSLCDPMDCSRPGFLVLHYPEVCSNSHPLNWWCHPTISSPVAPFSSCPHPSHHGLFQWVDPLHQVAKVLELQLPINIQGWFLKIDWFDLLAVQGILKSLLQHHIWKHQFFGTQPSLWSDSHIHTWLLQ